MTTNPAGSNTKFILYLGLTALLCSGSVMAGDEEADPTGSSTARTEAPASSRTAESDRPPLCASKSGLSHSGPDAPELDCFCANFADCDTYPNLSCSDLSAPCNCDSDDRNCAIGERGYVSCGGTTTYCGPVCPPSCPSSVPCLRYQGRRCSPNGSTIDCESGGLCVDCFCQDGEWECFA